MPTALIMRRISRATEAPDAISDEALAAVRRVVLAIVIDRVTAVSYIDTSGPDAT